MSLPVLNIIPLSDGMSVTFGDDFRTKQVQGGTRARRRFLIGNPDTLTCTLRFEPEQYGWFMRKFVEERIDGGVMPFIMPLIIRDASPEAYEVSILEGGLSAPTISGPAIDVALQLEVRRKMPDDMTFYVTLDTVQEYVGHDKSVRQLLDRLAIFANRDVLELAA
jgi:hypothetical protein